MDNRKTGQKTYVTWVDFLSLIGCFVLQDDFGWFHHSRNLWRNDGESVAQTSRNVGFICLHVVLFRSFQYYFNFWCMFFLSFVVLRRWRPFKAPLKPCACYCCFGLFVPVFEKIASQKLSLPEPYLVDLATVLGHLYYEGSFLFLFIPTTDRSFKDGIVCIRIITK